MEKVFTKEAVEEALRLTAVSCCGLLSKEYIEKVLDKLPKDLSRAVMAAIVSAKIVEHDLKLGESLLAEGNLWRRSESFIVICYNSKQP